MIKDLVKRGRSVRNFEGEFAVSRQVLEELVDTARFCASGANLQPLKYYLACSEPDRSRIFSQTNWAMKLKDVKLPFEGMEPSAYIAICVDTTICRDPKVCHMDVGIAGQTMMLAAVEKGLGGCFLGAFSVQKMQEAAGLAEHLVPCLVLALGKAAERVEIVPVPADGSTGYYREGMTNFVPKRSLAEIIINR